jgi:hypothetical protein
LEDSRTATQAIKAARRSTPEWIASEMTDTDPIPIPTTSFMATSKVLDRTETAAAFDFEGA